MAARRSKLTTDDPLLKVAVFMPASLVARLRNHAELAGATVSELCRESVRKELGWSRGASAPVVVIAQEELPF